MRVIPDGYCHCGCGQKTKLARWSHAARGWVKGQPIKFINGHRLLTEEGRRAIEAMYARKRKHRRVVKRPWPKKEIATIPRTAKPLPVTTAAASCIAVYRAEKAARQQSTAYARAMAEAKQELAAYMANLDRVRRGGRPKKRSCAA